MSIPNPLQTLARFALLALVALGARGVGAEPIEPPLEALYAPTHLLIAGKVVEVNAEASRVVFELGERISGNRRYITQSLIDVLVPAEVMGRIAVGERYLVGYSIFEADPGRPVGLVGARRGPTLIVAPGLEPALFRDTPAARKLIGLGANEHRRESRAARDLMIATLKDPDVALRSLAAGELAYSHELAEQLRPADRAAIEAFVADDDAPPAARAHLLRAAAGDPDAFGGGWPLDRARALLSTTSLVGYTTGQEGREALVFDAFSVAQNANVPMPADSLERWLGSDSVGLVETALRLLRQWYPDRERSALEAALARPEVADRTRGVLREYLLRLERDAPVRTPRSDSRQ